MSPVDPTLPDDGGSLRDRLAIAMKHRKITSREKLAELAGVSPATVKGWFRGKEPRVHNLAAVAEALGVSVAWLVGLTSEMTGLRPGLWLADIEEMRAVLRCQSLKAVEKRIEEQKPPANDPFLHMIKIPAHAAILDENSHKVWRDRIDRHLEKLKKR